MGKALKIYMSILHTLLKLSGLKPQAVEIEPGTRIHFWLPARTKPTKPVVVFLHGFGPSGIQAWQFQVLSLASTYDVYVPSFLFFGGSTTDKRDRSPEFQAKCVGESLKKLGVRNCCLVGWSYGGIVGFKMAEMYPDLVKAMVVCGSDVAMTESYTSSVMKRIGFGCLSELLIPFTVEDVKRSFDVLVYKLPRLPKNMFYSAVLEILSDNRRERQELLEALITNDEDFDIPCLSQKIYLVWGENDELFPMEAARKLKEQLNGRAVSLESIERAAHLVQLERPFAFNHKLKIFLSSIFHDHAHL